jgi:hypothetical protein
MHLKSNGFLTASNLKKTFTSTFQSTVSHGLENLRYQLNDCVFSWLLPAKAAELLTFVF